MLYLCAGVSFSGDPVITDAVGKAVDSIELLAAHCTANDVCQHWWSHWMLLPVMNTEHNCWQTHKEYVSSLTTHTRSFFFRYKTIFFKVVMIWSHSCNFCQSDFQSGAVWHAQSWFLSSTLVSDTLTVLCFRSRLLQSPLFFYTQNMRGNKIGKKWLIKCDRAFDHNHNSKEVVVILAGVV